MRHAAARSIGNERCGLRGRHLLTSLFQKAHFSSTFSSLELSNLCQSLGARTLGML